MDNSLESFCNLLFIFTVACRLNRLLRDFPYKLAIFTRVEYNLIFVENPSFCHHLFVLMWEVFQWVLAGKYSGVVELQGLKVKSMKKAHFSM